MVFLFIFYAIKKKGYTILEAENDQVALRILDRQPVDLILSDINMPEMNGLDFERDEKPTSACTYSCYILNY